MPATAAARQPDRSDGGWFAAPLAQRLLREELRQATPMLTSCYGQTGLYLRVVENAPPDLSGNMLQNVLRLHRAAPGLGGDLRCDEFELPLLRESVDLVYLLHAVETSAQPQQLLLEIERVLTPEGNLMLVALNPYSLWRLRWARSELAVLGAGTCRSMLRDAGFEVMKHCGLGPALPWFRDRAVIVGSEGVSSDPFAVWRASYLIQARKRRRGLTPVRPRAAAVAFEPGMRPG